ncbi:hypothetical protein BLOT_008865 [Blomia tropicalis]|nr:hypothetical protein BLOT_008865 [Blomia tropicalis]
MNQKVVAFSFDVVGRSDTIRDDARKSLISVGRHCMDLETLHNLMPSQPDIRLLTSIYGIIDSQESGFVLGNERVEALSGVLAHALAYI